MFLSYIFPLVYLVVDFERSQGHTFSAPLGLFKELIITSKHFYFNSLALTLNFNMPMLLASQFLSPGSIGLVAAAKGLSELLFSRLASAFQTKLFSLISNAGPELENLKKITVQVFLICFSLLLIFFLVVFTFSEFLMLTLYGQEFKKSHHLVRIFTCGALIYYSCFVFVPYLQGSGYLNLLKYFYFFAAGFQLVAGFIFFEVDSGSEIAVISVISMLILSLIISVFFFKEELI